MIGLTVLFGLALILGWVAAETAGRCPKCGGQTARVRGWRKRTCISCNHTYDI